MTIWFLLAQNWKYYLKYCDKYFSAKIRVKLFDSPSFLFFILCIILIEDKPLEKSEILHDLMLLQKIYFYLSMNIWITCKLFPLWQKMLDNCGTLLNRIHTSIVDFFHLFVDIFWKDEFNLLLTFYHKYVEKSQKCFDSIIIQFKTNKNWWTLSFMM